jgi:hypothetical protein
LYFSLVHVNLKLVSHGVANYGVGRFGSVSVVF